MDMHPVLREAIRYYELGYNLLPLRTDGTKAPVYSFKTYGYDGKGILNRMPELNLAHFFTRGIGILCGRTSGGLEVLDFDHLDTHDLWRARIDVICPFINSLPVVATPDNGRHYYYKMLEPAGNTDLAAEPGPIDPKTKEPTKIILIQTRGDGGYVVAPGSPLNTHPTGKPYQVIHGDLGSIPLLTPAERELLWSVAREFNTYVVPERPAIVFHDEDDEAEFVDGEISGTRPGDGLNLFGKWEDILEPAGWSEMYTSGGVTFWRRPGKTGEGCSATTGYGGHDILYVFSSSVPGFESDRGYSKFSAFANIYFSGDRSEAGKELERRGYGVAAANFQVQKVIADNRRKCDEDE